MSIDFGRVVGPKSTRPPVRWALALAAALFFPNPIPATARAADMRIAIGNQVQTAGGGSFEVDLTNESATQSYGVEGFSLELLVAQASHVQFPGATTNTTANPYIFEGSGTGSIDPTFDFVSSASTPTDIVMGDVEWLAPDIEVGPGATFGLAVVTYSVGPRAAPGPLTIDFGPTTGLTDSSGNAFDISAPSGTITITAGTVPEPSGLLLLVMGISWLPFRRGFTGRVAG